METKDLPEILNSNVYMDLTAAKRDGNEEEDIPEILDVGDALLEDGLLAAQLLDLELEHADVLEPLVVLHLALVQHALLDLDLLVQQRQLVVPPHQLRAQDVALADHLDNMGESVLDHVRFTYTLFHEMFSKVFFEYYRFAGT